MAPVRTRKPQNDPACIQARFSKPVWCGKVTKFPQSHAFVLSRDYAITKHEQSSNHDMARNVFIFLRPAIDDALLVSTGCFPKNTISQLEPKVASVEVKLQRILSRTRRYFTPPVGAAVRQSRNGSYYRAQKKIEIISRIIRSTCSRSRLPQEKQGSPPAILLFLEAGIAPRNILYSFQQGSPLVRKIAVDKGRPS